MSSGTLRQRWLDFWFEPASPANLGILRLLFFSALFLLSLPRDFVLWGSISKVFWMPIGVFEHAHLPVFSEVVLGATQKIWKLSLLLSAIGLATRFSTTTSFLLGFYLLGLPNNFGKTHHFDTLVVFALGIFALSHAGNAWSLDHLVRTARGRGHSEKSGEYTWPVRAMWLVMTTALFAAGVAKLRASGIEWVRSENMALILTAQYYHLSNADPLVPWGLYIAQHSWLYKPFALFALVFETAYPLALFSRRARWILVPGMVGLLVGIRVLMGPTFWNYLLCHIFWIPWDRVGAWLSAYRPAKPKLTVFYDGGCGLCQGTVAVVRSLDLRRKIVIRDVLKEWEKIKKEFPRLDREACLTDMHAVTNRGKVVTGFDAYREMAWLLPLGWLALPVLYFPLIRPIGIRIYRAVASSRHRGGCPLPPRSKP